MEKGADAVEYLAVSEEIEWVSGRYFEGKKEALPLGQAFDSQARRRLWDLSIQIAGS